MDLQIESIEQSIKNLEKASLTDRAKLIQVTDQFENTLLHLIAKEKDCALFKKVIELLPPEICLDVIKLKNSYGATVLHLAASHAELLEFVLQIYPPSERIEAVTTSVRPYPIVTVLGTAVQEAKTFRALQEVMGEKEVGIAIHKDRLLFTEVENPVVFERLINAFPAAERLSAIEQKNYEHSIVLHKAVRNLTSLEIALALYPQQELPEAVKARDRYHNSVLHTAASSNDHWIEGKNTDKASFIRILSLYPKAERLAAVGKRNKRHETVVHRVAHEFELLKIVLELYPENERFNAIQQKSKDGASVLYFAAQNLNSLMYLLSWYPECDGLQVIKDCKENHIIMGWNSILNKSISHAASFKYLISFYPVEERFSAITEKMGNFDFSILSNAICGYEHIPSRYNDDELETLADCFGITIEKQNAESVGQLLYFVNKNCGDILTEANFVKIIAMNNIRAVSIKKVLEALKNISKNLLTSDNFDLLFAADDIEKAFQKILSDHRANSIVSVRQTCVATPLFNSLKNISYLPLKKARLSSPIDIRDIKFVRDSTDAPDSDESCNGSDASHDPFNIQILRTFLPKSEWQKIKIDSGVVDFEKKAPSTELNTRDSKTLESAALTSLAEKDNVKSCVYRAYKWYLETKQRSGSVEPTQQDLLNIAILEEKLTENSFAYLVSNMFGEGWNVTKVSPKSSWCATEPSKPWVEIIFKFRENTTLGEEFAEVLRRAADDYQSEKSASPRLRA